jgi:AraC family transcriptional regulator
MNPVQKAIWFVEGHLDQEIGLDDIAEVAGLSRFHLVRAFGAATGRSVMRYVRGRRLSEAARGLADGAPDILAVALDAGYGSHEAFTRAFRDQFGATPEQVRQGGCARHLQLVEPMRLDTKLAERLPAPRIEHRPTLLLAGLTEHYTDETSAGIPNQWQRFAPWIGNVPGGTSRPVAYGVVCNADDGGAFDYMSAVEVGDFAAVPPELSRLRLAAQRYAVFANPGHVTQIRPTCHHAWGEWLPASGETAADAPFVEFYPEAFDPMTGQGGFEMWLPLKG